MKKLVALSMAAMMMAMITPIAAAEKDETKDVDTTDGTSDQNGEIWATLSSKKLAQLKATMPIRIDFAVVKGEKDGAVANDFMVGDYKIKVASDSEIGVELKNITVQNADKGKWTLTDATGIAATKTAITEDSTEKEKENAMKTVSLQIAGKDLAYGENKLVDDTFVVKKGTDKSLGIKGAPTQAPIDAAIEAKAELAFNVVYTIAQKEESAPAA